MSAATARPWIDPVDAEVLTADDLERLDRTLERASEVWALDTRIARDEYMRDEARRAAKVRRIIGDQEPPLPTCVREVNRFTNWELTDDGHDAVRFLDAEYADEGKLNAALHVDQYASGRLKFSVSVSDCRTTDPRELARWAAKLLALAQTWEQIPRA